MTDIRHPTFLERFWAKVDKTPGHGPDGECWVWTAVCSTGGYGQIRVGPRKVNAHKIAWELVHGAIPKGEGFHGTCVMHRCDNRKCVNPAHLRLGTHTDNMKDMGAKKRNFVLRGSANNASKLTADAVLSIRARAASGEATRQELAAEYGVSVPAIRYIVIRKNWNHI